MLITRSDWAGTDSATGSLSAGAAAGISNARRSPKLIARVGPGTICEPVAPAERRGAGRDLERRAAAEAQCLVGARQDLRTGGAGGAPGHARLAHHERLSAVLVGQPDPQVPAGDAGVHDLPERPVLERRLGDR